VESFDLNTVRSAYLGSHIPVPVYINILMFILFKAD